MAITGTWGAPEIAGVGLFPTRNLHRIAYVRRGRFMWVYRTQFLKLGFWGIRSKVLKFRRYCKRMERAK